MSITLKKKEEIVCFFTLPRPVLAGRPRILEALTQVYEVLALSPPLLASYIMRGLVLVEILGKPGVAQTPYRRCSRC